MKSPAPAMPDVDVADAVLVPRSAPPVAGADHSDVEGGRPAVRLISWVRTEPPPAPGRRGSSYPRWSTRGLRPTLRRLPAAANVEQAPEAEDHSADEGPQRPQQTVPPEQNSGRHARAITTPGTRPDLSLEAPGPGRGRISRIRAAATSVPPTATAMASPRMPWTQSPTTSRTPTDGDPESQQDRSCSGRCRRPGSRWW